MNSLSFMCERLLSTSAVQTSLSAPPTSWVWSHKTPLAWVSDVSILDQLKIDVTNKRALWRAAAATWDLRLDEAQRITRDLKREGRYSFRADAEKAAEFARLKTGGQSREAIYAQGDTARAAWAQVDVMWKYDPDIAQSYLASLLSSVLSARTAHETAFTTWRGAARKLMNKARAIDTESVAWYAAAVRKFPAGTDAGDLIRTVPTTYTPPPPVGQALITNIMVSGGDIHFDCNAPHATRFTYLYLPPGATEFLVLAADSPNHFVTLHDRAPGLYRFKAIGRNSGGEGEPSVVIEITVADSAAA